MCGGGPGSVLIAERSAAARAGVAGVAVMGGRAPRARRQGVQMLSGRVACLGGASPHGTMLRLCHPGFTVPPRA